MPQHSTTSQSDDEFWDKIYFLSVIEQTYQSVVMIQDLHSHKIFLQMLKKWQRK